VRVDDTLTGIESGWEMANEVINWVHLC
jgi:hypothetical protein